MLLFSKKQSNARKIYYISGMMKVIMSFVLVFTVCLVYFDYSVAPALLQTLGEGLGKGRAALAHMESDCEALLNFLTPGKADHIRAKLAGMRLQWEELKSKLERMDSLSASYRDTEDAYDQVCKRAYS